VAGSYAHALELVEGIARRENIDCGFKRLDGYLIGADAAAPGGGAVRAGVAAELLPAVPGLDVQLGPCARYPGQAQLQRCSTWPGRRKSSWRRMRRRHRANGAVAHGVGALIIKRKSFFWYPKTSFPRRRE